MTERPHPACAAADYHRIDLTPAYRVDAKGRGSGQGKATMIYCGLRFGASREPLYAAARYLLDQGLARPGDTLATFREGIRSMSAQVGWAAGRSVIENDKVGPKLGAFRPFVPADQTGAGGDYRSDLGAPLAA